MSAYVVDDRTLDRVVAEILRDRDYPARDPTALGRALAAMNITAVATRYEDRAGGNADLPERYVYTPPREVSAAQRSKTLQCYLYQCTEGAVPECELYRDVERAALAAAWEALRRVPEYESAGWGEQ